MKRVMTIALALAAGLGMSRAEVPSHWDGGRNMPVHRLALNDEFGDPIVPNAPNAMPVSTRQTCGQCHDYATIAKGWHFNMSCTNAVAGRPAQPWFLVDPVSGSQIPMSLRDWPGTYKPAQLGMSHWEWVYEFGRHLPGGDIADPADLYAEGGDNARWIVSGPLEINCFACHSTSKAYDHSEWVRLIMRQNYRWAATGALGLGEVRGMGSRVADYWGIMRGLNPDDSVFSVPPHVVYDRNQFDMKNRTVLEMGAPRNENCLNCHSTTQVGMPQKEIDGDVHLRAGMSCADCHGNGEDHATARGYEGDNTGVMDHVRATASCTGCHVASDGAKAGRHGAPAPKHVGMPLSHFRNLSCTACHSGVTKDGELAQVRTSRANRMGVYGRARWATPQPYIIEPVFVRNDAGKIEPRRMAWPAFWGSRGTADKGDISPIRPETVQESCARTLNVRAQLGEILAILATNPNVPGAPAFAAEGKLFKANADLVAEVVCDKAQVSGLYYTAGTNLVAVLPDLDPTANTDEMEDEALEYYRAEERRRDDLLQTLDAAPLALTNGFGAVVLKGKLFYRGGEEDAVISVDAPVKDGSSQVGWFKDGVFTPLVTPYVTDNCVELANSDCRLTEAMLKATLAKLAEGGVKDAVYVAHGQVWELDAKGELVSKIEKAAEAVSWAVGHDVRPARMARGAKPVKCADCHTVDSKFFFSPVASTGPLLTAKTLVKAQHEFMELSGSYNRVFGVTFLMRPFFKIFLWVVFALVLLVAVAFTAAAVPALLSQGGIPYGKRGEKMMTLVDNLAALGLMASAAYLGISGVLGWFFHLMTGYILVFHMVGGGLFVTCLAVLIWTRGGRRIANAKRSWLWMLVMALGVCVVFTAVAPMMTWFGEGWQLTLLWAHRCTTLSFIAVGAWMLLSGGRKE